MKWILVAYLFSAPVSAEFDTLLGCRNGEAVLTTIMLETGVPEEHIVTTCLPSNATSEQVTEAEQLLEGARTRRAAELAKPQP